MTTAPTEPAIDPALASDLAARVRRGAELLDAREPGWHERIALDRLAMQSCTRCILGQLHEGYGPTAANALGVDYDIQALSDLGFDLPYYNLYHFVALGDLWRAEVRRRLDAPPSPAVNSCVACGLAWPASEGVGCPACVHGPAEIGGGL